MKLNDSRLIPVRRLLTSLSTEATPMFSALDTELMSRALRLARRGRFWARPNPHVGCVLWRDGRVIGEGFTQPAGGNHAEVEALSAAGDARGATAYVTLEPCNHRGRTGPCSEALLEAGVARVVAAMEDPNPQVAGAGLARLRDAGVAVSSGLLAAQAEATIAGFVQRMRTGRPRVRIKMAMSLDGRTAMASGESQWITGPAARADVQRLRAASCAILTGSGTALADDCSLTLRPAELGLSPELAERALAHPPLRVLLDRQGQLPASARIFDDSSPTLVLGADGATPAAPKVEFEALPVVDGALDLAAAMHALGARQINEILVESGPRLAGALLRAGLADEIVVYMAPILMGSNARPLLDLPLASMADKVPLEVTDLRRVGEDWRYSIRVGQHKQD